MLTVFVDWFAVSHSRHCQDPALKLHRPESNIKAQMHSFASFSEATIKYTRKMLNKLLNSALASMNIELTIFHTESKRQGITTL